MISRIATTLPEEILSNAALAVEFPEWSEGQILAKTGISERRVARDNEYVSDLGTAAARQLLGTAPEAAPEYLLFCTQTPDLFLPTTACLVHERLGLPSDCGAIDLNLGCSGYVYGLSLASALIKSGQVARVLLITADTYTKLLRREDKTTRTIFGDGAAATLLVAEGNDLHSFVLGTDGRGAKLLQVESSAMRGWHAASESAAALTMDGPEIYNFTLKAVPALVQQVCERAGITQNDVDYFVFHQANGFMLESLRRKIGIPPDRFEVSMRKFGNTVSSTIPIALREAERAGRIRPGMRILLAGFGVGLSWGGCLFDYKKPLTTYE
jgi:3-oxoacyl-[acyl-carrier-protein] synthase III